MKRSLKVLKRNPVIKKIPIGKCMKVGDKCNSMIRTKGVDQAWWDMQYGNQLPSWRHE